MRFLIVISGPSVGLDLNGKVVLKECLLARMEKTLELWSQLSKRYDDLYIITSGWDGDGSRGLPSSTAMKNYLLDRGVPSFRVYEDTKAQSTKENALNCCALMVKCAKDGLMPVRSVESDVAASDHGYTAFYQYKGPIHEYSLVTSAFHLKRASILFEKCARQYPELSAAQRWYYPSNNGIEGERLAEYLEREKVALGFLQ